MYVLEIFHQKPKVLILGILTVIFFLLFFIFRILSIYIETKYKQIFRNNFLKFNYEKEKKTNLEEMIRNSFSLKTFILSFTFLIISLILMIYINLIFFCINLIFLLFSYHFYKKKIILNDNKLSNFLNKINKKIYSRKVFEDIYILEKYIKIKNFYEYKKLFFNFYFEIIALIFCIIYLFFFTLNGDQNILKIIIMIISLRFLVSSILKFKTCTNFL